MVNRLEKLIKEHHTNFQYEFNYHITPKLHFMIHYPTVIKRMGPLTNLWCMRYEGKHAVLKALIHKFKNFKNVAKTLAKKVQQMTVFEVDSYKTNMKIGPSKHQQLKSYAYGNLILREVDEFLPETSLLIPNWLKYGYKYTRELVVCTGMTSNDLPIFEKIIDIFIIENVPFFITDKYSTAEYVSRLNAFKVMNLNENNVVNLKLLMYKEPFNFHQTCSGTDLLFIPKYTYTF